MPIVVSADDVTTLVNTERIVVVADAVAAEVRRAKPPVISLAVGVMDINASPNTVGDTIIHHTIQPRSRELNKNPIENNSIGYNGVAEETRTPGP